MSGLVRTPELLRARTRKTSAAGEQQGPQQSSSIGRVSVYAEQKPGVERCRPESDRLNGWVFASLERMAGQFQSSSSQSSESQNVGVRDC